MDNTLYINTPFSDNVKQITFERLCSANRISIRYAIEEPVESIAEFIFLNDYKIFTTFEKIKDVLPEMSSHFLLDSEEVDRRVFMNFIPTTMYKSKRGTGVTQASMVVVNTPSGIVQFNQNNGREGRLGFPCGMVEDITPMSTALIELYEETSIRVESPEDLKYFCSLPNRSGILVNIFTLNLDYTPELKCVEGDGEGEPSFIKINPLKEDFGKRTDNHFYFNNTVLVNIFNSNIFGD